MAEHLATGRITAKHTPAPAPGTHQCNLTWQKTFAVRPAQELEMEDGLVIAE